VGVILAGLWWLQSAALVTPSQPEPRPTAPSAAPLQWISTISLLHTRGNSPPQSVSPIAAAFRSQDEFQISYATRMPHCLYVGFFDAEHQQFTMIFPKADTLQPLQEGDALLLPDPAVRFALDNVARTEVILLILSREPLAELDNLARSRAPDVKRIRDVLQQLKSNAEFAQLSGDSAEEARLHATLSSGTAWVELRIDHR
jgi:hypothetical protein